MLALDYGLRPVLSALDAKHVLPSIYATELQINWSVEEGLMLDPAIAKRVNDGIEDLSASLFALNEVSALNDFGSIPFSSVRCSV
jgi:FMN reductase